MKIGIDITQLNYAGSGVANYTFNLVKNLLLIDKKNQYHLFYSSLRRPKNFYYLDELKKLGGKIYDFRLPPRVLKFLWCHHDFLPIEWLIGKVDVFFSSDFLRPPLLPGAKGITTIHDLTWKLYPQYHTQEIIDAHEKKLEKTIKYGDEIIVDSENTKNDLLKLYPQIDEKKVHIIYPGVDERFKKIDDKKKIEKVLKRYLSSSALHVLRYILYVGAIEPRKNLDTAIKVFSQLIKDKKYADFKFLIVGKAGWKNEKIFQLVKDLGLEDKVIFVGFVDDDDLPCFYSGAKATLYLSKYEGFGLPPLESLACGTPVLAGKNSSLREILEEKYLVDESDEEKILKRLKKILNEEKSVEIKKRFSWRDYGESFLKIVESIK